MPRFQRNGSFLVIAFRFFYHHLKHRNCFQLGAIGQQPTGTFDICTLRLFIIMAAASTTEQLGAIASGALSGGHTFIFQKPIIQNKQPSGRGGCTAVYVSNHR